MIGTSSVGILDVELSPAPAASGAPPTAAAVAARSNTIAKASPASSAESFRMTLLLVRLVAGGRVARATHPKAHTRTTGADWGRRNRGMAYGAVALCASAFGECGVLRVSVS